MLVDTLTLRLNNVRYDAPNLKTQSPSVDIRTGEIAPSIDIMGYRASKAYCNTDTFNYTCKAKQLPNGYVMPLEAVKFSVPKVLGMDVPGVNLDAFDVSDALGVVRDALRENGIYTDTFDAGLWRVDSTADVVTEYSFEAYSSVFENMQYHHFTDASFGSTFRLGGKTKQFCIYDKVGEYKARGMDVSHMPPNVMRFEYRTVKARALREAGFCDVTALLDNYDELRAQTLEAWYTALFRIGDNISHASPENCLQAFTIAQNDTTRWISHGERILGLRYLLENGYTPNGYYRYLVDSGISRPTAGKHRDDMIGMQFTHDTFALYDELKCKLTEAFTG